MKNSVKLASAILATSLLVIPVSNLISSVNIAKAENIKKTNIEETKEIVSVEYLSYEKHMEIINTLERDKLITKEEANKIKNSLNFVSAFGWIYIVTFSDGARDVHIPGWMVAAAGAAPILLANAGLGASGAGVAILASFLTSDYWTATKTGIVIYQKPVQRYNCEGPYYAYVSVLEIQHVRLDV